MKQKLVGRRVYRRDPPRRKGLSMKMIRLVFRLVVGWLRLPAEDESEYLDRQW